MAAILNENPRDAEMWCSALKAKFEGDGKPFGRSDWYVGGSMFDLPLLISQGSIARSLHGKYNRLNDQLPAEAN